MCNVNRSTGILILYLNLIMQSTRTIVHILGTNESPISFYELYYARCSVNRNVPEIERMCCQSHHNLKKNTTWTTFTKLRWKFIFTKRINANLKINVRTVHAFIYAWGHFNMRVFVFSRTDTS